MKPLTGIEVIDQVIEIWGTSIGFKCLIISLIPPVKTGGYFWATPTALSLD